MDAPVALIAVALAAAGALLLRDPRRRAASLLAAVALDAVLVVAEVGGSDQLRPVRADALLGLAAGVGIAAALGALAWLFTRRPAALPIAAALALPFRLPVEASGSVDSVLVALQVVVTAGALAYALPRLRTPGAGRIDGSMGGGSAPQPAGSTDGEWSDVADASPRRGAVTWLLALATVLYAVQSTYGDDAGRALHVVAFLLVPGAALHVLLSRIAWTPRLARQALVTLAGVAVVLAGVAVAERATRHVLVVPGVLADADTGSVLRIGSAFFDPELFGRFLVVAMLGLAAVLLWGRRARDAMLATLGLAVLWAGVVVTLSAASLVALLAGLAILAAARWQARWAIGAAALAIAAVAALVVVTPGTLHLDRERCAAGATSRCGLAHAALQRFEQRPERGFGAGTFVPVLRAERDLTEPQAATAARSAPVVAAVEQGVPGLVALAALVLAGLATLLRRLDGDPVRAALAAAFAAVAVHGVAGGTLLGDPLAWGLLGLGVALDRVAARERHRRRRGRVRAAPVADERPAVLA